MITSFNRGKVRDDKTSLTLPLFVDMPVPFQESDQYV